MPAILSRQVKVTTLGYDWRKIQRKMVSGQKTIYIHRQPRDGRFRNQCKNCGDLVQAKCDYCSPSCKVMHKPNGHNANLIQDLVNINFAEEALRDVFCLSCLRAFASAHCANHNLHIHGAEEEGGAPVLVVIREYDGWKLITADVIGQPMLFEHLRRIPVDGVEMVAVCRRHVPHTHGANCCANPTCYESVDQAGDICCLECLFMVENEAEDDEVEGEEHLSPQELDSDEDED